MIKKFFILFILIFVFSSSFCFASATLDNIDFELFEDVIEHINKNSGDFFYINNFNGKMNAQNFYTAFLSKKNEYVDYLNSINASNKNLIIFIINKANDLVISIVPTNNTVGELEYIYTYPNSAGGSQLYTITNYNSLNINLKYDSSYTAEIANISKYKMGGTDEIPNFLFDTSKIIINYENSSIHCSCFYGINAEPLNIIHFKSSSTATNTFYFTLDSFTDTTTEVIYPDTPGSGDNESGDIGGGTTPSGDTPGTTTPDYNEKLDNIQTGINNIENKIPTSGDITQSTTTGVIQGNTSYWGSSGDLTGKEQEETIEQGINDVIDTVSGDFAKNEIFQMLDHYNSQMWGIFTGETDFKIEWSDVKYQNTVLIPSGGINFTQICKDIEILGYIKSLINIIISFHIILALVEQIYNLILSTLGIDNPYLYEDGNYTEITNVQTGERTEKLYRNRRVYKK